MDVLLGFPLSEADLQMELDRRIATKMFIAYRPSYADWTYEGGGRSSARETVRRVAPGALAKKILKKYAGTEILAYVSQVHKVILPEDRVDPYSLILNQSYMALLPALFT
ncbi:hypothetical protein K2173_011660 [Erythroxylum novogranatense]|uniref:chorismate synthase n=1 Tax=Erythroxylum novogranatense TaxID=1862640 RepID=A0AAV8T1V1_9ROSI|nr:hypothetical protein K2173_011660 [Erythroxylum novogranatense]